MKMKRLLLLALVAMGAACGQCTLWNQTGCGGVYAGTPNPSLASFLSNAWANFQAIDATVARLPQPKMTLTAQSWPCLGSALATYVPAFGPYCVEYSNLLKSAGVTVQDFNIWQLAMASSAEYQAEAIAGQYNIAGDCVGNAGAPYLTLNQTPGTGSGPHCMALHYYDLTFANMAANGMTLRAGDPQMTDDLIACGLSPGGTLASPTIAIAQYQSCITPLHKAEIARWPGITAFQVMEEPTAGMVSEQVFSVADVSTFIQNESAALKAINNNGLMIGASGTGMSWPQQYDNAYWADWTNKSGSTYSALDFYVVDLFSASCDLSAGNTMFPGQLYYAAELANWVGPFSANPANKQWGYITAAKAAGKPVRIGQSDAPMWCPASGIAFQSNDILGQYDIVWDTSGMFNTWLATMVPWASANGVQSFAIFFSAPLFYYSSTQSDDNEATQAATAAMANLAATDSAATYKMLGKWFAESLEGNAYLSGHAHLGR